MLFKEVNRIIPKIEKIEPQMAAPAFSNEMIRNCATSVDKLMNTPGQKEARQLVLHSLAAGCIIKLIVPLPEKLKQMIKIVKDNYCPLPARCVLAGALGYLVQPNDLIPDNAKGGYGFVDDAVLVHAAYAEYLRIYQGDASETQESTELARLAAGICPPQILGPLDTAVTGILMGFQLLSQLPQQSLEWTLQQIIANPYQASVQNTVTGGVSPQHVKGWTPQVPIRNSLGMTFTAVGGNMMATFPDGGMVIVS
jgi:uncharacterized membrane protein YkvA (DUF1232 family)